MGIDKRHDANPSHMRAYASTMGYAFEKYFAQYGENQIHLEWLITPPDFRRRGAATRLCNWGRSFASKRGWMWTVIASPMGQPLYEHLGCHLVGTEPIRVHGEDESVDIFMMEESYENTSLRRFFIALLATLGSLSLGILYFIFRN